MTAVLAWDLSSARHAARARHRHARRRHRLQQHRGGRVRRRQSAAEIFARWPSTTTSSRRRSGPKDGTQLARFDEPPTRGVNRRLPAVRSRSSLIISGVSSPTESLAAGPSHRARRRGDRHGRHRVGPVRPVGAGRDIGSRRGAGALRHVRAVRRSCLADAANDLVAAAASHVGHPRGDAHDRGVRRARRERRRGRERDRRAHRRLQQDARRGPSPRRRARPAQGRTRAHRRSPDRGTVGRQRRPDDRT